MVSSQWSVVGRLLPKDFPHTANGVGQEEFFAGGQILDANPFFLSFSCFEQRGAIDAGQKAAFHGRGEEAASFLNDQVGDGGFCELVIFVPEEHVVASRTAGPRPLINLAVGGFVVEEDIAGIDRSGGEPQAARFGQRRQRFGFQDDFSVPAQRHTDPLQRFWK